MEVPRSISEKIKEKKKIEIAENKNILAVYDHVCKKCGYNKAQLIEIHPFYSDEDQITRYKCGRCGYVEQTDDKIK